MLSESDQIDIELKMDRRCYASIIRGTQDFSMARIKLSSPWKYAEYIPGMIWILAVGYTL